MSNKREESFAKSVAKDVGKEFVKEGVSLLRWTGVGAAIGAVGLGAAGFYYFGSDTLLVAIAAGAVLGGIACLILRILLNSSLFF